MPGRSLWGTLCRHEHDTEVAPTLRNGGSQLRTGTFYSENPLLGRAEKAVYEGWPPLKWREGHYDKSRGWKGVNQGTQREAMTTRQQPQLSERCASD